MAKVTRTVYIEEEVWKEAQKNVKEERPEESLSRKVETLLIRYNSACQITREMSMREKKEQEEKK